MLTERTGGILMHLSSLPGPDGIGTMGKTARHWVDQLTEAGQRLWQILPLGPTGFANSPYASWSAFAGNPLFIDLSCFDKNVYNSPKFKGLNKDSIDYEELKKIKVPYLKKYAKAFISNEFNNKNYLDFKFNNRFWLNDYALFHALKEKFDFEAFNTFPDDIRLREESALREYGTELQEEIEICKATQYFFFEQWNELKTYANSKGLRIVGDIPLYVAEDSVDVWAFPEQFMLDNNRKPTRVAGVPPDYFSQTGQLWGNPVYDWEAIEKSGFWWWTERVKMNFKLFDILRIDHFRGFSEFWAVPEGNKTAEEGEWLSGPGDRLLNKIYSEVPHAEIIAEDLGVLTDDVIRLRDKYRLPGMKILQFAFDSDASNQFLPHNYDKNCIVYTGTHDNDTNIGWFTEAMAKEQNYFKNYTGAKLDSISQSFIKTAYASAANTAIIQMQDLLGLSTKHRMNTPGIISGNWEWRMAEGSFTQAHKDFLLRLSEIYGRNIL
ncbi:MAG: 4-alpha-glucanotransferase [Bacteroidota bacterium]|nr:4-alpha-glucanotransferase [Bacteroidota bacterium]